MKIPQPKNSRIVVNIILSALYLSSCGGNSGGNVDYVALGASDATGIGATAAFKGYVFEIRDELDDRCESTNLINLGIPTALAGTIESTELPVAVRIKPEIVTLWTGPNDIIAGEDVRTFESKLGKILGDLRKDTSALIYVGNIPDLALLPELAANPDVDVTEQRIQSYNEAISRQAASYNVKVVNLASIGFNADYFADDGFHPSGDGHHIIAQLFLDAILPDFCGIQN